MNKIMLTGRLTKDPDVRYSTGEETRAIARYSIAVNRSRKSKNNEYEADFFNVVCFGKSAEFVEKYFKKGMKVEVVGHVQTGSYTDREGVKRQSFDVVVEEQGFAESKSSSSGAAATGGFAATAAPEGESMGLDESDGFMPLMDDIEEELPF